MCILHGRPFSCGDHDMPCIGCCPFWSMTPVRCQEIRWVPLEGIQRLHTAIKMQLWGRGELGICKSASYTLSFPSSASARREGDFGDILLGSAEEADGVDCPQPLQLPRRFREPTWLPSPRPSPFACQVQVSYPGMGDAGFCCVSNMAQPCCKTGGFGFS